MTMLSSSSPVAATSEVGRPRDAGALEHEQLGRVAADHLVLELRLELVEPVRLLLDQRHLVAGAQQRPGQVRADLAAACDQDVHLGGRLLGVADGADERLDRGRRRADDAQPLRRVELRARRIEHADDHRRHLEVLLRRLGDHEVRVVAVGRDDDSVRLLDPGLRGGASGPCRGRRRTRRSSSRRAARARPRSRRERSRPSPRPAAAARRPSRPGRIR